MTQKFTSNDLVRFLYHETTASETLRIEQAMESNTVLRAEYNELLNGCRVFPKVKFNARQSTLQSILSYSQKETLETSF